MFYYSPSACSYLGLCVPAEQIAFGGSIIAFLLKGLPNLLKTYHAFQYIRSNDSAIKNQILIQKLKVDTARVADIDLALKHVILKGKLWSLLPVAITLYCLNAKRIQRILTEAKRNA